jgi:hypothetical protein
MFRRFAGVVGVLAFLMGSTACVSEPAAPSDLPDSGSNDDTDESDDGKRETGTATPKPPVPVRPKPGEHPAETMVRQFIAYENHALLTGDVAPMLSLSDPACESCQGMASVVREIYQDGGHVRPNYRRTVTDITQVATTDPPVFQVELKEAEQVRISATGEVEDRIEPDEVLVEYATKQEGRKWLVEEITSFAG